jgi:glucose-6-phosphate 1-dehydrogenase
LTYKRRFSDLKIPEAYEALLLDAFKGDHSNFVRDDELDASWRIFTPLLHYLDDHPEMFLPLPSPSLPLCSPLSHLPIHLFLLGTNCRKPDQYEYGSRGPAMLDEFMKSYGFVRGESYYSYAA